MAEPKTLEKVDFILNNLPNRDLIDNLVKANLIKLSEINQNSNNSSNEAGNQLYANTITKSNINQYYFKIELNIRDIIINREGKIDNIILEEDSNTNPDVNNLLCFLKESVNSNNAEMSSKSKKTGYPQKLKDCLDLINSGFIPKDAKKYDLFISARTLDSYNRNSLEYFIAKDIYTFFNDNGVSAFWWEYNHDYTFINTKIAMALALSKNMVGLSFSNDIECLKTDKEIDNYFTYELKTFLDLCKNDDFFKDLKIEKDYKISNRKIMFFYNKDFKVKKYGDYYIDNIFNKNINCDNILYDGKIINKTKYNELLFNVLKEMIEVCFKNDKKLLKALDAYNDNKDDYIFPEEYLKVYNCPSYTPNNYYFKYAVIDDNQMPCSDFCSFYIDDNNLICIINKWNINKIYEENKQYEFLSSKDDSIEIANDEKIIIDYNVEFDVINHQHDEKYKKELNVYYGDLEDNEKRENRKDYSLGCILIQETISKYNSINVYGQIKHGDNTYKFSVVLFKKYIIKYKYICNGKKVNIIFDKKTPKDLFVDFYRVKDGNFFDKPVLIRSGKKSFSIELNQELGKSILRLKCANKMDDSFILFLFEPIDYINKNDLNVKKNNLCFNSYDKYDYLGRTWNNLPKNKDKKSFNVTVIGFPTNGKSVFLSRLYDIKDKNNEYKSENNDIKIKGLNIKCDPNGIIMNGVSVTNMYLVDLYKNLASRTTNKDDSTINMIFSLNNVEFKIHDTPGGMFKAYGKDNQSAVSLSPKAKELVPKTDIFIIFVNTLVNAKEQNNDLTDFLNSNGDFVKNCNPNESLFLFIFSRMDEIIDNFDVNSNLNFLTSKIDNYDDIESRITASSLEIEEFFEKKESIFSQFNFKKFFYLSSVGNSNFIEKFYVKDKDNEKYNVSFYKYVAKPRGLYNILYWLAFQCGLEVHK